MQMHNYKVETLLVHSINGPKTEFSAKDDLQANDIAQKFCKSVKGTSYNVFRLEKNKWHQII